MVFSKYFAEEEDKINANTTNETTSTSGASGTISGGDATTGEAAPEATGSGFVGLDKYLTANRGQSGGLVDTLTSGVEEDVSASNTEANSLNTTALADAGAKDTSGSTPSGFFNASGAPVSEEDWQKEYNNQYLIGGDKANDYWTQNQGFVNSAKPKVIDYTISEDQKKGFAGIRADQVDIGADAEKRRTDNDTQTALFKDEFGKKGNYSSGFSMLDSFLMNADQNANVKEGGVNQLDAGLDAATGSFVDTEAQESGVSKAYDAADALANKNTKGRSDKLKGRTNPGKVSQGSKDKIFNDTVEAYRDMTLDNGKNDSGVWAKMAGGELGSERKAITEDFADMIGKYGYKFLAGLKRGGNNYGNYTFDKDTYKANRDKFALGQTPG
tara:strand:+ start:1988 stop:3142 length:1155 start_codon:yes stop_codon:yes gene_type:complete